MIRWLTGFALLFVVAACDQQDDMALPPKDFLVDVLTDLYIAEVPMARVPHAIRDSVGAEMRAKVARQHGLDPAEMEEMIARVQTDAEFYIELCDSVLVRLEDLGRDLE